MPRSDAGTILGAMRSVALEHGEAGVTELDRRTIEVAATVVLGLPDIDLSAFATVSPGQLAAHLTSGEEAKVDSSTWAGTSGRRPRSRWMNCAPSTACRRPLPTC